MWFRITLGRNHFFFLLFFFLNNTVGWVLAALLVARWTHFYSIIWMSDKPNRWLLRIAMLGMGIIASLILYLTVYLPKVKKLSDSSAWNVYCPRVIPTMTIVGIVTLLLFIRALWPVWGFLSPLIFGTEVMGALMSLHFLPIPGPSVIC